MFVQEKSPEAKHRKNHHQLQDDFSKNKQLRKKNYDLEEWLNRLQQIIIKESQQRRKSQAMILEKIKHLEESKRSKIICKPKIQKFKQIKSSLNCMEEKSAESNQELMKMAQSKQSLENKIDIARFDQKIQAMKFKIDQIQSMYNKNEIKYQLEKQTFTNNLHKQIKSELEFYRRDIYKYNLEAKDKIENFVLDIMRECVSKQTVHIQQIGQLLQCKFLDLENKLSRYRSILENLQQGAIHQSKKLNQNIQLANSILTQSKNILSEMPFNLFQKQKLISNSTIESGTANILESSDIYAVKRLAKQQSDTIFQPTISFPQGLYLKSSSQEFLSFQ